MIERPIPFSAPMVRAILAGAKTQTRRVVKGEPPPGAQRVICPFADGRLHWAATDPHDMEQGHLVLGEAPRCPYGQPGDRLWVREAFRFLRAHDNLAPRSVPPGSFLQWEASAQHSEPDDGKLRPGMFMPRWASRILLEITSVRVTRLQHMSASDAQAEGIVRLRDGGYGLPAGEHYHSADPRESFWSLWESINGPGSVQANPWVWVLEFKRVEVRHG